MTGFDWLVVIVMGAVGWLVVSFLLNRAKPNDPEGERSDDRDAEFSDAATPRLPGPSSTTPSSPAPVRPAATTSNRTPEPARFEASNGSRALSLDEMSRSWHSILAVRSEASAAEIETAYHAKLAACDQVRFATDATPAARQAAEQERALVSQAYEFIRPSRPS